ncbi:MAG: Y-family DNA polymerase [Flavobacteriaceae bacterium]|jgi:DNA polymerase V|nr:Y-family DNA polymerase [Flavobacteriaceae bacterium]MBL6870853.1 Y-family DNA polymerase [Flavobacteriaceae bacterium]MDG1969068.1 Y-family DNA polymerase [Flavobacteriaceae bacterium]|tara:strand:+ start:1900 stop:3159 length:1260 start_codon:yes stop_codon:yes gene_type:complete
MFALIDCNNFYASCERVFQPQYEHKAVVILSNNDGCVIARSNEAKALGIPMGAPAFKFRNEFKKHNIKVFSSNYPLYGDMSNRVMKILETYTPNVEIYSIDEAFLKFEGFDHFDLIESGFRMRKQVRQWTGIPVSVGLAPSKALAKIANKIAKKFDQKTGGVYAIDSAEKRLKALKWTPIEDVWGVGRQHAKRLKAMQIKTALDFVNLPDEWVKKHMSILGLRLKRDLEGIPSIQLEEFAPSKKSIATTRSFKNVLNIFTSLEERITTFTLLGAEKLRKQKSCATALHVFVRSNPFNPDAVQYRNGCTLTLPHATDSNFVLNRYALMGLRSIFKPGIEYKKAGVILLGITPSSSRQITLFEQDTAKHAVLMQTLDKIHRRYGPHRMKLATQDLKQTWKMKREHLSNRFTTEINEIIRVK